MTQPKALRNLKKLWAGGLCVLALFIPDGRAYASDQIQKMIYDVYAGGFHVVQADVTIDTSNSQHYELFMGAKTHGFLGKVAPWQGTFETNGWKNGGDLQPQLHRSSAIWRGEEEIKSYNYSKDGGFQSLVIKDHDKPEETEDIDAALTQGTTDALTAGLLVFEQVARGEECTGSSEVFDGKRRFEQIFTYDETDDLSASKYNIYSGPAQKCTVEIKPISGKWHDKPRGWLSIQEQGRERGMMPTVWLANVKDGGPAIPVKIRVKTAYGTLFMHLAQYESGGNTVVAEKRGDN
jgi:hypothetical protein